MAELPIIRVDKRYLEHQGFPIPILITALDMYLYHVILKTRLCFICLRE